MSNEEKIKWDRRWTDFDPQHFSEPTSILVTLATMMDSGDALDIACGEGRNSVYLAQRGFRVHALDISSKAIDLVKSRASDLGVAIHTEISDLDEYTIRACSYDLITTSFYVNRDPQLILAVKKAVKPGGFIVQEQHCDSNLGVTGPSEGRFRLRPGELINLFSDLDVKFYSEVVEDLLDSRISVARIIAQKPYGPP